MKNETMNNELLSAIIDPEIPETPEQKRQLLERCLAAIALDLPVVGISPRHVSIEGVQTLKRARPSDRL